jgi:hypothetical protein
VLGTSLAGSSDFGLSFFFFFLFFSYISFTQVIAKIDATANDVEHHIDLKGFPTLALYKKDAKATPVIYQGEREAAAIETWLQEHK